MEVKVKRDNVVLRVDESAVKYYLNRGYNVIKDGKVIKEAVPTNPETLKAFWREGKVEIEELREELKKTQEEVIELKSELKKLENKSKGKARKED